MCRVSTGNDTNGTMIQSYKFDEAMDESTEL